MWLMLDFPFLQPACSWRSSLSTAAVMCWRMMRQKTLLVMGCRDASPVATFGHIPFHWEFDYCTPLPSVVHHFIVPDVRGMR